MVHGGVGDGVARAFHQRSCQGACGGFSLTITVTHPALVETTTRRDAATYFSPFAPRARSRRRFPVLGGGWGRAEASICHLSRSRRAT